MHILGVRPILLLLLYILSVSLALNIHHIFDVGLLLPLRGRHFGCRVKGGAAIPSVGASRLPVVEAHRNEARPRFDDTQQEHVEDEAVHVVDSAVFACDIDHLLDLPGFELLQQRVYFPVLVFSLELRDAPFQLLQAGGSAVDALRTGLPSKELATGKLDVAQNNGLKVVPAQASVVLFIEKALSLFPETTDKRWCVNTRNMSMLFC